MSEQGIDHLIDNLCEELEPVKPLPHPLMRMLPLIGGCILYVLAFIWMEGMRTDFSTKMLDDLTYVFELSLAFAIAVSAAITLGFLAVPDMRGAQWLKTVPVTLLGVFLFWTLLRLWEGRETLFDLPILTDCFMNGIVLLLVPVILLTFFTRMGASTYPGWSAFMTVLSFSGLGWIGLRVTCGMDDFAHAFVYDFLPFICVGIVIGFLSRVIFRW